jgi:hypothetical protein
MPNNRYSALVFLRISHCVLIFKLISFFKAGVQRTIPKPL